MSVLRRRLFEHTGDPWEGETIALKIDLTELGDAYGMRCAVSSRIQR
jgi:hypothetical protein